MKRKSRDGSRFSHWSEEEDRILRESYSKIGPKGIHGILPNRTPGSVRTHALKLGLLFKESIYYSPEEILFLTEQYPLQGWRFVAEHLGRTKTSVIAKAMHLGVRSGYKYKRKKDNKQFTGYEQICGGFWTRIQDGARERDFEFSITIEYAWEKFLSQNDKCALSDVAIAFPSSCSVSDGTASLDRIDSTKGYIEGNVQWVHKDVNKMKWDLSERQFIEYCRSIAKKHHD